MYEHAYIKERIDDHVKWYSTKARQSDHISGKITINIKIFNKRLTQAMDSNFLRLDVIMATYFSRGAVPSL